MSDKENKSPSIADKINYFYIKNIKKWMFCPACKDGKMSFVKKKASWVCEDCGYSFSEEYFLSDCVFWFCDECDTYLNNQEGFDRNNKRHICQCCGYENDTTFENIAGVCSDCNKKLPDPNATLCADCRQARREKAKEWLIKAGKIIGVAAAAVGVVALAMSATDDSDTSDYTPLPDSDNDDDEVYGLGEGNYPSCKTCGADMTEFDGWAWYTCPECGDKVRIIEGKSTWYNEIFGTGKIQHHSDFELADFCRGGDLTED